MSTTVKIKALTIPSGTSTSNVLDSNVDYVGMLERIVIQAPAALDGATTYSIEVSHDNSVWATLCGDDGTTALPLPAAAKARTYFHELQGAMYIRLKSSGNVAADRTYILSGQEVF